jgi:hypothetical protein
VLPYGQAIAYKPKKLNHNSLELISIGKEVFLHREKGLEFYLLCFS